MSKGSTLLTRKFIVINSDRSHICKYNVDCVDSNTQQQQVINFPRLYINNLCLNYKLFNEKLKFICDTIWPKKRTRKILNSIFSNFISFPFMNEWNFHILWVFQPFLFMFKEKFSSSSCSFKFQVFAMREQKETFF